jgi:hypothetical protein
MRVVHEAVGLNRAGQSASPVHVLGFTASHSENDEIADSVVVCHCNLWLQWLLLAHDWLCLLSAAFNAFVRESGSLFKSCVFRGRRKPPEECFLPHTLL